MLRAVDISLRFATASKRKSLETLASTYREDVNFFISSLWKTPGKLDKATESRRTHTRLTARYKSRALKHALGVVISTRRACKAMHRYANVPVFTGAPLLDAKFVTVTLDKPSKDFDLFVKISSLKSGNRITVPAKRTRVLNKWLALPGATLVQGCALHPDRLTLFVEIPDPPKKAAGAALGADLGMIDLVSLSDGTQLGSDWKRLSEKMRRKRKGSKAFARCQRERTNFINRVVNRLPWSSMALLAVENLKNLKRGKSKKRGKAFRRACAPWTYRRVLGRFDAKCQENGVRLAVVDPAYTSRLCPVCGTESAENRKAKVFRCVACGHAGDADTVGARNILARALSGTVGSLEPPTLQSEAVNIC